MKINFNDFIGKKYWKIRIRQPNSSRVRPYLEILLMKMGMDSENIEFWKYLSRYIEEECIYLIKHKNGVWRYVKEEDIEKAILPGGRLYGYIYGGEITYDKKELEEYKLKKTVKKYNL